MNKKQTRLFAIASTGIAALVLLVLTLDTHRQFPKLTNSHNITDSVIRGQNVWHANNCINCHTMLGEGAYYAPDDLRQKCLVVHPHYRMEAFWHNGKQILTFYKK